MSEKSYALFSTPVNMKITADLKQNGSRVFTIPVFDDVASELDSKEVELLQDPLKFNWIALTDIFAVDHFIKFLNACDFDLFELDSVRICAFGDSVSDRLRFSEIHSDIISSSVKSSKIFAEICEFEGLEFIDQRKFLVLKEWESGIDLTNILRHSGAATLEIPIYKLNSLNSRELAKVKALISGGGIDEVILSSAEELVFFEKAFGFSKMREENLIFSSASHSILQMLSERAVTTRFYLNPNASSS